MEKLTEQRDTKIEKVEELQKKYNIRVKGEEGPGDGGGGGGGESQGVLA
jgi:prefoldin subunit 2